MPFPAKRRRLMAVNVQALNQVQSRSVGEKDTKLAFAHVLALATHFSRVAIVGTGGPAEPIPATGDDEAIVEDPLLFVDSIADDVAEPAPPEPAPNGHAPDEPEKQDDNGEDDFGEDW